MIDLALSILSSSLIFVIFKLFATYRIQTLFGIIVNYITACMVGILFYDGSVRFSELPARPWFPGTVMLGALFILVFNLMARTSQKMGVSVASVATKMSLAIPVLLGVALYNEHLGTVKVIGILMALAAVYFSSVKKNRGVISRRNLVLPSLVFLGSGVIDGSIKFMQATSLGPEEFPLFSATVFAAAASTGFLIILVRAFKEPMRWNPRNLIGGICLGIPNFFSIYFLLRALQNDILNSASIFTINNVAIVMLSTLLGILLFKEQLSLTNWSGIVLAITSIFLVALF